MTLILKQLIDWFQLHTGGTQGKATKIVIDLTYRPICTLHFDHSHITGSLHAVALKWLLSLHSVTFG